MLVCNFENISFLRRGSQNSPLLPLSLVDVVFLYNVNYSILVS